MDKKVAELINKQINAEFYSGYLYLSFADYYEERGLKGFANWYVIQAQEERDHALIMRNYLHANGEKVTLSAIDEPGNSFGNDLEPLEAALEHEKFVTSLINAIYAAADEVHDYRTMQWLDWFVSEQGEEEENAQDLVDRMKLFGGDAKSLYDLDQECAARVYTQAAPLANA
jgi:ferritin